jgi:hypothetical protein
VQRHSTGRQHAVLHDTVTDSSNGVFILQASGAVDGQVCQVKVLHQQQQRQQQQQQQQQESAAAWSQQRLRWQQRQQ